MEIKVVPWSVSFSTLSSIQEVAKNGKTKATNIFTKCFFIFFKKLKVQGIIGSTKLWHPDHTPQLFLQRLQH